MDKDAFYFPHFSNARNDRRLKRLRKELNIEGYGIYFMLLEVLREQKDFKYPACDIDLLADEFGTSEQKLITVINNYGLFQKDKNNFFSLKFNEYLKPYLMAKYNRRIAGIKGNLIKYNYLKKEDLNEMTDAEIIEYNENRECLSLSDRPATATPRKGKKSKEESKEDEIKEEHPNFKPLQVDFDKMIQIYNKATKSNEQSQLQSIHVRKLVNEDSNFTMLTNFLKEKGKLEDVFFQYFEKAKASWKGCNLAYVMNPKNYVKIWSYKTKKSMEINSPEWFKEQIKRDIEFNSGKSVDKYKKDCFRRNGVRL